MKKFANAFELLAEMENVRLEREVNHKLHQARVAAYNRRAKAYIQASNNGGEEWLDYLHERRVSADLNLTVCNPDNPPT